MPPSNPAAANADDQDSLSRPLVVTGVPEHFNLPWHLALENNLFANAGIELTYRDVPGGTGAMTKELNDGTCDLAIVLAEGCVASLLQGNPSWIVKTYVESPLIWGIHVAADSDIHDVAEIQDQRYAISRFGSGSHLMSIVDASERGWPTADMNFEKVGNLEGARSALSSGEAETFFWERFTTAPLVHSGEFRCLGVRETLWPAFVICARDKVLETRAGDIKTVLEIINQSCAALMADPNACQLISSRYSLKLDEVKQWFSQTEWSTDFECPAPAIERIKSYLVKLGIVTKTQSTARELWYDLETPRPSSNPD